jgi:hypothetical protein
MKEVVNCFKATPDTLYNICFLQCFMKVSVRNLLLLKKAVFYPSVLCHGCKSAPSAKILTFLTSEMQGLGKINFVYTPLTTASAKFV